MLRKLSAEFFGTFWLVFGGCGSAILAAGFPSVCIGFVGVSFAFGLTVLTMAYAVGGISGGHFNPEVDSHGRQRSNATHGSSTDPDARLYKKGRGKEAKLCFMGHGLMEMSSAAAATALSLPPAELPSLWWRFVGNVMALARDAQGALPKASAVPSDIAEFSASPGGHKRCRLLGGVDRRDPIHGQPRGVRRYAGALAGRQRYKFPLLLPNCGCGRPSPAVTAAGPVRI